MRFLVDQNLPEALAVWIESNGHEAEHVKRLGLAEAPDGAIRAHAMARGAVMFSKDADFAAPGAALRVIWVRIGNTTNDRLLTFWSAAWPSIVVALEQGDALIEAGP